MLFNLWAHASYFLKDFVIYIILLISSFTLLVIGAFKIYKSALSPRRKKIILALASTAFCLVLVFSFFEAYFRYVYDESDGLGYLKVNQRWNDRHVIFNSYFVRDRDFNFDKKEEITRIGVMGDSLAFGAGIKNVDNRFSNLLEKKLKETGENVEVYNFGKPGHDTQAEIEEYRKLKTLNFDIIVWEYYLNDIQPQESSTGTPIINRNSQRAEIVKLMSDKSFFLDFLYWRFSSKYQKTIQDLKTADLNQYKNAEVLESHKKAIKDFLDELKSDNKQVVVIIFPFIQFLGPSYPAEEIHKQMSGYFSENGVQVIDLLPDLKDKSPKEVMASRFDAHPNEFVHRLATERLYEKVTVLLSDQ
ncbi:MAG: SGNH/GDSL hydrolase family protein [Candidatus Curtissbacteria bacterium]